MYFTSNSECWGWRPRLASSEIYKGKYAVYIEFTRIQSLPTLADGRRGMYLIRRQQTNAWASSDIFPLRLERWKPWHMKVRKQNIDRILFYFFKRIRTVTTVCSPNAVIVYAYCMHYIVQYCTNTCTICAVWRTQKKKIDFLKYLIKHRYDHIFSLMSIIVQGIITRMGTFGEP